MLSLFTGGAAKWIGYGALAVTLMGGAAVLKRNYDNGIIAQVAAKQAAVDLATERADNARLAAALADFNVKAEAQAVAVTTAKEAISHAPPSAFSCIRSPAGRAALGALRGNNGR